MTLVLAGCGSKQASVSIRNSPETSNAAAVSPTTTAVSAESYSVPATVDVAYINKVIAVTASIRAETTTQVLSTRTFSPQTEAELRATYTGDALDFQLGEFQDAAYTNFPNLKSVQVAPTETVASVHALSQTCVWVTVNVDNSVNEVQPTPGVQDFVLVQAVHDLSINPTPWMLKQSTAPNYLKASQACG